MTTALIMSLRAAMLMCGAMTTGRVGGALAAIFRELALRTIAYPLVMILVVCMGEFSILGLLLIATIGQMVIHAQAELAMERGNACLINALQVPAAISAPISINLMVLNQPVTLILIFALAPMAPYTQAMLSIGIGTVMAMIVAPIFQTLPSALAAHVSTAQAQVVTIMVPAHPAAQKTATIWIQRAGITMM